MKEKSKVIDYLINTKDPYAIKMDNMNIEMIYSKSNKTFEECMLNVLKQKYRKGWHLWLSTLQYRRKEENLMVGRKSKYSANGNNTIKNKIWSVALYIRLSQEDEDNRKRKARK